MALDDEFVEMPECVIVEEGPSPFILPGAGHRWNAGRRMHLRGAVAAAGEAIAKAEESAPGLADCARESLDLGSRHAANCGRPFRRTRLQMRLKLVRTIRVFRHIGAVGQPLAEQHMHHAAGERTIGAWPQDDLDVGLLHRVVVVDIDDRDPCATFLLGASRMRHHVDLGVHGVGAPDHHEIGDAHLARIDAGDLAGADGKSDAGDVGANRRIEARIFLHIGETIDAVAHHDAHRAGVVIRPDGFGAEIRARPGRSARRPRPAPRPRRCAHIGRSPSARCGASDGSPARDDGCARHNARPWRRRHRPYRSASWNLDTTDRLAAITSTSSAQADGQSCGQLEWRTSSLACWFMPTVTSNAGWPRVGIYPAIPMRKPQADGLACS